MQLEEAIKDIKRICEYLKESNYMSIDKDTKISLETILNHLTKQEKMKENAKQKIKSLELQCKLCNIRSLIECDTQCTIGTSKKCLKELMEVDNE